MHGISPAFHAVTGFIPGSVIPAELQEKQHCVAFLTTSTNWFSELQMSDCVGVGSQQLAILTYDFINCSQSCLISIL